MEPETRDADSAHHRPQPFGIRVPSDRLVQDDLSCFDSVTPKPLAPVRVPERPRNGELDRSECAHCRPSEHTIRRDERWQVRAGWDRTGLPFVGGIAPREHVRLDDAPVELLADPGPLLQRVSAAVKSVPGVARCHFSRWGDGSEHVHLGALARPAEMTQGRGAMLGFWEDVLPDLPDGVAAEHFRIVAASLAAHGGEAFPHA
jgi:hypothetical protein